MSNTRSASALRSLIAGCCGSSHFSKPARASTWWGHRHLGIGGDCRRSLAKPVRYWRKEGGVGNYAIVCGEESLVEVVNVTVKERNRCEL